MLLAVLGGAAVLLLTPIFPAWAEDTAPQLEDKPSAWAVVDPATGNVLNSIVCTFAVCGEGGSFGGVLYDPASGITGKLVYQAPPSESGNVAGYRSDSGSTVTWDENSEVFHIDSQGAAESSNQRNASVLNPALNAEVFPYGIPEGESLILTEIRTEASFSEALKDGSSQNAVASIQQASSISNEVRIGVEFSEWNDTRIYEFETVLSAASSIESVINTDLIAENSANSITEIPFSTEVSDAIRTLASQVAAWFTQLLGISSQELPALE